jgi:hypothetical protein
MKISVIIKNSLLLIVGIIILFSCDKNNKVEFKVIPEVILMKKEINDTIRYALAFYAYSTSNLQSAEVTFPGSVGSPVSLTTFKNNLFTFAKEPGVNDYSKTAPLNGEYQFSVQNTEGEIFEGSDFLAASNLEIPTITGTTYNTSNNSLKINWEKVEGTDSYFVKLLNQNLETVYTGYMVDPDSTNYTIFSSDQGWEKSPVSGNAYTLQLNAVLFEDHIDLTEYYYHVNSMSIAETQITWNP